MAKALAHAPIAIDAELRKVYLQKKIAQDIYHSQVKIYMTKTMHVEISFLWEMLQQHDKYNVLIPIAHLVKREPNFQTWAMPAWTHQYGTQIGKNSGGISSSWTGSASSN